VHIVYFFTYGYSLKSWHLAGILKREIAVFEKMITDHNLKFTFVTYGDIEDLEYVTNENIQVIPIFSLINRSEYKLMNFLKSFFLSKKLKHKLTNVDIVKQNQLLGSWASILFKISIKKPLYVRTGYDMFKFSINEKKIFLKRIAYYTLTLFTMFFANIYSVTSSCDKTFLKKYIPFVRNKIVIRPNWVESKNYKLFDSRISNKLISVGRLESQKNYPLLIRSLKKTELSLDLVGEGSLKNELKSFAKKEDVKINFLGIVENTELINLYSKYKYFISTSSYEGNPKAILEAMAAGCIVIAKSIPNNIEIISHLENGILFKDETELIDILNNLTNIENQKDISTNAINHTNKNNSLKLLSNNLFDDFKLLNNI